MDRSDVVTLIKTEYVRDARGVQQPVETRRDVFCNVSSISMTEFYKAGQLNLKPAYRFTIFAPEYDNEQDIEYKGHKYTVYRTFHGQRYSGIINYKTSGDHMELYAERRTGEV